MSETTQQKPAEIEAIGYLTGAVTGYERAGGSSPVIVVPVGYVRTLLAALAEQEAERRDSERLDWMEQNPGFDVQVYDEGVCVWDRAAERFVILDEANARDAIDAARQSTPTGGANAATR